MDKYIIMIVDSPNGLYKVEDIAKICHVSPAFAYKAIKEIKMNGGQVKDPEVANLHDNQRFFCVR